MNALDQEFKQHLAELSSHLQKGEPAPVELLAQSISMLRLLKTENSQLKFLSSSTQILGRSYG